MLHQALICPRGGPSRRGTHQEAAKGRREQRQRRARGHPRAGGRSAPWAQPPRQRLDGSPLAGEGAEWVGGAGGCRGLPKSEQAAAPAMPRSAMAGGRGRLPGTRHERWQPAGTARARSSEQPPATPGEALPRRGSGTAGQPLAPPQPAGTGNGTRTSLWTEPGTSRGRGAARQRGRRRLRNAAWKHDSGSRRLTCLVATSERFRRVQRQFWTSLGLELVRCLPSACMPPAREGDASPAVSPPEPPRGEAAGLRGERGLRGE